MINFLEETKLSMGPKKSQDIDWIGSMDGEYAMTWEEFEKLANFEYDGGFGSQKIASDLVIVFKDGSYLERAEYDGSEWWEFKTQPEKKENAKPITNLGGPTIMWDTLEELNK